MFKRFLKIFGLALGGVVVGIALIVGIAFLAGAFNEKIVEPTDIAFVQVEEMTSTAIDLRVTTTTEDVNRTKLTLQAEPAGIVKLPAVANIGEDFIVWPEKDAEGNNIGGQVTITASYNGTLYTSCVLNIDVPVKSLTVDTEYASLSKGDSISFNAIVYPERALRPGKLDQGYSSFDREKTIYYVLYDEYGQLMDTSYAYFADGPNKLGNMVATTRDPNDPTRPVVTPSTVIRTEKECNFYLKAYMHNTFSQEDKYKNIELANMPFNKMLGGVSSTNDTKGQLIVVADVYIDSMTATYDPINTYWFEQYKLVARKDGKAVNGFDMDIKLLPKESTSGYDYTSLDYMIDNIQLEWVSGAEVSVVKDAEHFKGTDPSTWTWTIVPTVYSDQDTTAMLKASITYRTPDGGTTATSEWNFTVNMLTRPVNSIVVDYYGQNQIELNSDLDTENFVELQKDMKTTITNGFTNNTYKYFNIIPGAGQPYSTFSLLKFYLPETTSTKPTKNGMLYKFTFEIELQSSEQTFTINFTDDGSLQGSVLNYYAWTGSDFASEPVQSGTTLTAGRYRVEGIYTKNDTRPAGVQFTNGSGSKEYEVKNLKYYEQDGDSFSIYPYAKIEGVRVYTEFNSDTLEITSNLAKIMVDGYGSFDLGVAVMVTTQEGTPVVDENGDFVMYSRGVAKVKVTNSVKEVNVSISDKTGGTTGIAGAFETNDLKVDENGQYYIQIRPTGTGDDLVVNTEVLRQAYESGALKAIINVVNQQYVDELGLVINKDSIIVGAIEEDIVSGSLVGYKLLIDISNVYTIELEDGSRTKLEFDLVISVEESSFESTHRFTVVDNVITKATIKMSETDTTKQKNLYAVGITASGVTWHSVKQGSTQINPGDMTFVFTGFNDKVINETPTINFASKTTGFNLSGLVYIDPTEKKLVVNNVPYYANGGAVVEITLLYSGDTSINSRYISVNGTCTLTTYEDAMDVYTLNIYGFNIEYEPNSMAETAGEAGAEVNLLSNATYNIRSGKGDTSRITSISLTSLITFQYTESTNFVLDGTTLKVKNSLVARETVSVALYIGANLMKSHSVTFKSPYQVTVTTNKIKAPATAIDLRSHLSVAGGSAGRTFVFTFVDAELETGDRISDFVSIADGRITIKHVPIDFDIEICVEIFDPTSKGVYTGNMLRVINQYNSEDRTEEEKAVVYVKIGEDNEIVAGSVNAADIDLQSNLTSGKTVTNVEVSFNTEAQAFMRAVDPNVQKPNRSVRALHIGQDTEIVVYVKIYFQDAGYTIINVPATVLRNFFITFSNPNIAYGTSGQQLNDFSNFNIVDLDGNDLTETGIQLQDFSYSLNTEARQYLTIDTTYEEVVLKVIRDVSEPKALTVTISYNVMEGSLVAYTINFEVPISVNPAAA